MVNGRLAALRVLMAVMSFLGIFAIEACKFTMRPDQVLYACFDRPDGPEEALGRLRKVSDRANYQLHEYGEQAKADLKTVNANPATIPKGRPIQADIRDGNNNVVAIVSNSGSAAGGLRVSLFSIHKEKQGSPFRKAVISSLKQIKNAKIEVLSDDIRVGRCR